MIKAAMRRRILAITEAGTPTNNLTKIEVSDSDMTAITTEINGLNGGNRTINPPFYSINI